MTTGLEARVRRLEDRVLIVEQVIKYAMGVDRRDWQMFADCFTDPVYVDHSEQGLPAGPFARADFVAVASQVLNGFTKTQHISPNHVIEFDGNDSDRAVCHSYMYAQHLLEGPEGGDSYLLRGTYTNHMLRTPDGWRIERNIQHVGWSDGNGNAVAEAATRTTAAQQA
ncbi:nuclear transport factor 2 family protein [Streptomyces sp. TG1A-8]|uniref:nuclear transport factor 2 family protein n=1 Tax=Streptomyces sp. TG1A-8 TaxID=3051385 RepID=UPI00265C6448|nr:nuclear transport factor 2 family protein [Streptomyces sp. TG1A-8]MDO0929555.1 nuclear transport factor 2 family protein [Streptomyces sp. TG1A-8]